MQTRITLYAIAAVDDLDAAMAQGLQLDSSCGQPAFRILFKDPESAMLNVSDPDGVALLAIDASLIEPAALKRYCPVDGVMVDVLGDAVFCTAAVGPERLSEIEKPDVSARRLHW